MTPVRTVGSLFTDKRFTALTLRSSGYTPRESPLSGAELLAILQGLPPEKLALPVMWGG